MEAESQVGDGEITVAWSPFLGESLQCAMTVVGVDSGTDFSIEGKGDFCCDGGLDLGLLRFGGRFLGGFFFAMAAGRGRRR